MKDGRAITIPVDSAQVDAVTVTPLAGASPSAVLPTQVDSESAISRAARQRREAEERNRAQSDTANENRARAETAADAAEAAQRAAEAARARAEAAAAAIERLRADIERAQGGTPAVAAPDRPSQAQPSQAQPSQARPSQSLPARAAATHRVGSGKALAVPSAAARVAKSGDTIEIEAGTYDGDVAVWTQDNLTLRGVGGMVELRARGLAAEGKAIWVIRGNNVTVENIDFSGAQVADQNGAGLRGEGAGLTIRRSRFHDNQMGILVSHRPDSDVVIDESEFFANTTDYHRVKALGHNVYIGTVRSFVLKRSYIHHASIGHNVKSWALTNYILNNRIMDERDGGASYQIDMEVGGTAYVIGNVIHKSVHADNISAINFASSRQNPNDRLYVINNTIVIDLQSGQFVQNRSAQPALVANNIFVGNGAPLAGPGRVVGNLLTTRAEPGFFGSIVGSVTATPATGALIGNWTADVPGLRDVKAYDYRLTPNSPAIDRGVDLASESESLIPKEQYVHPLGGMLRRRVGVIDIGAYEHEDGR
jgi:hypothetical protein